MKIYGFFFALIIILASPSFGIADDNTKNRFTLVAKEEGVQYLYIDNKSIVRAKGTTQCIMVNQFIKNGKLYNMYKAKYPSYEPSFATWTMIFDCARLRAKVADMKLYDKKKNLIDKLPLDDRWNQLQIKNEADKNLYDTLCK